MQLNHKEQQAINFIESLSTDHFNELKLEVDKLNSIQSEIRLHLESLWWNKVCTTCIDNCCFDYIPEAISENELVFIFLANWSNIKDIISWKINDNQNKCSYLWETGCVFPKHSRPYECFSSFCNASSWPDIMEQIEIYENIYYNEFESLLEWIRLGFKK